MTKSRSAALPKDVCSTGGKLVYVYLSSVRESTVENIAAALNLKLIELLPTLPTLEGAGYVERQCDTCRLA